MGLKGQIVGIDHFGASAPAKELFKQVWLHARARATGDRQRHWRGVIRRGSRIERGVSRWRSRWASTDTAASAATFCGPCMRASARAKFKIVAINDLGDANTNAHLTRYDTAHGRFQGEIRGRRRCHGRERRPHPRDRAARSDEAAVGRARRRISCSSARVCSPARPRPRRISTAGAKKVVISAPGGDDVDATIVYGVNHQMPEGHGHGDLQRLLHHQLPGAARQGAARGHRRHARRHEHHSLLHQRSGAHRRLSLAICGARARPPCP